LVADSEASHAFSTIPYTEEDARRQKINKILNANNIDDRTKFLLLSAFKTPDSQSNDR
jgi:adenine-specific DNA methylase